VTGADIGAVAFQQVSVEIAEIEARTVAEAREADHAALRLDPFDQ
jgi:hypothetical protein